MRNKVCLIFVWTSEWEQEKIPKYRTEKNFMFWRHPENRKKLIGIKEKIYLVEEVKKLGVTRVELRKKLIWSIIYIVAKYWKKNVG